ncbi:hypothetical protein AB9E29_18420, partial [Rhizobium leguminosarum]
RQDDVQRMSPEDRFGIRNAKLAFVVRSEASTLPNFAAAADIVFGPQAVVVSGKRVPASNSSKAFGPIHTL